MPGGVHRGTVWWIEIPVAGRTAPVAELPPTEGDRTQGRLPGDKVLTEPSRPTTVVVIR